MDAKRPDLTVMACVRFTRKGLPVTELLFSWSVGVYRVVVVRESLSSTDANGDPWPVHFSDFRSPASVEVRQGRSGYEGGGIQVARHHCYKNFDRAHGVWGPFPPLGVGTDAVGSVRDVDPDDA